MTAFVIHNLSVRLGGRSVCSGINCQIAAGRWTAIVGPNGAGKTTLLKAMAGLQAFEGDLLLRGQSVAGMPARKRAKRLAWLGQGAPTPDELTAHDVVMLGRLPHQGMLSPPSAEDAAKVADAMRATGCSAFAGTAMAKLSGGERQRVLLARCLAVGASTLLLDEPLAHLDVPHQADWVANMRAQTAVGNTVVSVLHELSIALMADDVLVMQSGQLLHLGTSGSDATWQALAQAFEGRIRLVEHGQVRAVIPA